MNKPIEPALLNSFPRLGWVKDATPVSTLNALSQSHNAGWIGCKRDDLCSPLFGGTKVRKLDFLLASAPWANSEWIATMGAIGSGHVVASCSAAKVLNKKIVSHLFWEPITAGVPENLSYIASVSDKIVFHNSRVGMALSNPALFLKSHSDGCAVIPAGATNAVGMLGTVRAGLELAAQVRTGEIPAPKRIYAALGTGGTVAGLSIGLAMGGLETEIHAITTVETILSTRYHFNKIISNTRKLLVQGGHKSAAIISPARVIIIRNYLGAGYGHPTTKSLQAMEVLKKDGITIEPVYTGKAAAAMIDDLKGGYSEPVLFWNSMRSSLPEIKEGWKDKLPENLRKKLDEQTRNN